MNLINIWIIIGIFKYKLFARFMNELNGCIEYKFSFTGVLTKVKQNGKNWHT